FILNFMSEEMTTHPPIWFRFSQILSVFNGYPVSCEIGWNIVHQFLICEDVKIADVPPLYQLHAVALMSLILGLRAPWKQPNPMITDSLKILNERKDTDRKRGEPPWNVIPKDDRTVILGLLNSDDPLKKKLGYEIRSLFEDTPLIVSVDDQDDREDGGTKPTNIGHTDNPNGKVNPPSGGIQRSRLSREAA